MSFDSIFFLQSYDIFLSNKETNSKKIEQKGMP